MSSTLYSFVNFYMGGIRAGIQTAHLVHTIDHSMKNDQEREEMENWLISPTICVLEALDHDGLNELYRDIVAHCSHLCLPCGLWHESKEALNGATMAVGFVFPDSMKDLVKAKFKLKQEFPRAYESWLKKEPDAESMVALYQMTRRFKLAS